MDTYFDHDQLAQTCDWYERNHGAEAPRMAYRHIMAGIQSAGRTEERATRKALKSGGVAELTSHTDMPNPTGDVIERIHQTTPIDLGYESVFRMRDYRNTRDSHMSVVNVTSGLTFRRVEPMDEVELARVTGSETVTRFDRYIGAVKYDLSWWEDRKFWDIEDQTRELISKSNAIQSALYYGLISASRGDDDVALNVNDANSDLVNDVMTINAACAEIVAALDTQGIEVGPQEQFVIVCPTGGTWVRVLNAVGATVGSTGGGASGTGAGTGGTSVKYPISAVVPTTYLTNEAGTAAETDQYFVILPGREIVGGIRVDLQVYEQVKPLSATLEVVGHKRFGGMITNTERLRRCTTAAAA